jgi:Questin oxidase-like
MTDTLTDSTTTLHAQLQAARHYDAEYGHKLASHLPMALTALQRLGASDAQRQAFFDRYVQTHRLHAAPPMAAWPAGDAWRDRLGDPAAWPAYRGLFHAWVAHEGVGDVLTQVLPWLMPGAGAAAFHGLLRVSYGVAAEDAAEVADGLAYWACRWFDCGSAALASPDAPASDVAKLLTGMHVRTASQGLIAERMDVIARTPAFRAAMQRFAVSAQDTLPALARLAAEQYAASGNFTLLHVLTSTQAVQTLLPWIDEDARGAALAAYAAAGAAAWISATPRTAAPAPEATWDEVIAHALQRAAAGSDDDEHMLKCVDAAREWHRIDPHPRWLAVARRAVAGG